MASSTPVALSSLRWLGWRLWRLGKARLGSGETLGWSKVCVFRWSWVVSALKQRDSGVCIFADLLQWRRKSVFVWLHGFITWEDETKGLRHARDCVLDEGCDGNCTLDQMQTKKSNSVNPGV